MIPHSFRNIHLWYPGYLAAKRSRAALPAAPPATVWLALADHYEPGWRQADHATARSRVEEWRKRWPLVAAPFRDAAGRPPQYTFFYPDDEYRDDLMTRLRELVDAGIADVEIHLHHDGEGERNFVDRIRRFKETLHFRHGLLRRRGGNIVFGFIHGNWALDNSRPDGRWCGLNNELRLLRDLGCYADFTLPTAPGPTQPRTVNTIYWATDDPARPKSHDTGVRVTDDPGGHGDLLLIPGPLGFNCRGNRRILPRLETGELAWYDPPCPERARSWLRLAPRIGSDIFLKLYTHGAQEDNARFLLGGGLSLCLEQVNAECRKAGYQLRFASAYEMWAAVETARTQMLVETS